MVKGQEGERLCDFDVVSETTSQTIKVRLRWLGAVLQYSGKLVVFLMSLNILLIIIHH